MMGLTTRMAWGALVATLLAAGIPVTGAAGAPVSQSQYAAMYARSQQRGSDELANPDYAVRFKPLFTDYYGGQDKIERVNTDPYRLDWGCADLASAPGCRPRGEERSVWMTNRYGAHIHATFFAPLRPYRDRVTGKRSNGPFPAIIALTGGHGHERPYRGLLQGIAEAGYVVLGVEVEGDGLSDTVPPDPDPSIPGNQYCRPYNYHNWQAPQEMGISELGQCAGQDPAPPPSATSGLPVSLPVSNTTVAQAIATNDYTGMFDEVARVYDGLRARKAFGALDAAAWLLSANNPLRAIVDPRHIGIVGHSYGAQGALLAGNGDPHHRFSAVVSWDGFGSLCHRVNPCVPTTPPRVPTMFMHHDIEEYGPHRSAPDPDQLPGAQDSRRFAAAGIPTMLVTLAGSTHQEWNYIPYSANNPNCPLTCNSSRDGERVALYYTLGWLDRYLKPGARQQADAQRRLLARSFDGSADGSSIGQGAWDPLTQRNRPYMIRGLKVGDALSPFYRSSYAFGHRSCADLRVGCPPG